MRSGLCIVPAQAEHLRALEGRLRRADREEVHAATGLDADAGLRASFTASVLAWAALECANRQKTVVALFGVAPCSLAVPGYGDNADVGSPWLLGATTLTERAGAARDVVRLSRPYVARMQRIFPVLANVVDARHRAAVRWLRWCGFTVEPPRPAGPFGMLFHLFHRGGRDVHHRC